MISAEKICQIRSMTFKIVVKLYVKACRLGQNEGQPFDLNIPSPLITAFTTVLFKD